MKTPRKLTIGLIALCLSSLVAACAGNTASTNNLDIGPSFGAGTLYVANSSQNSVMVYTKGEATGKGPAYQIGGGSTGFENPQYLAFDKAHNLWITEYNASTELGGVIKIQALATGDVDPLGEITGTSTGIVQPRGISIDSSEEEVLVANTNPGAGSSFESQLLLYATSDAAADTTTPTLIIAGPLTGMNNPSGVVLSGYTAYVANLAGASVQAFTIPTPTPEPSITPSPTPTPTATPSGAPTATPSPTPTPYNTPPVFTLSGAATGITQPTGLALDASGNLYVSDQGSLTVLPSILIFSTSGLSGTEDNAPMHKIQGSNTDLYAPTDVAVDTSGNIYVADTTKSGAGVVYVFAAGQYNNVAPITTYTMTGTPVGLGLIP